MPIHMRLLAIVFRLSLGALVGLFAAAPSLLSTPAHARAGVFLFYEDADPASIPHDDRLVGRLHAALVDALNIKDFDVYGVREYCPGGEWAADRDASGRIRFRDGDAMTAADRRCCPAVGCNREQHGLAIIEVFIDVRPVRGTEDWHVVPRIKARTYNATTRQTLGTFEVHLATLPPMPAGCHSDRACILDFVAARIPLVAESLQPRLSERFAPLLAQRSPPPGRGADGCPLQARRHILTFSGFSADELKGILESLPTFTCYRSHAPLENMSEPTYALELAADDARMQRNLHLVMDYLHLKGTVLLRGDRYIIRKSRSR